MFEAFNRHDAEAIARLYAQYLGGNLKLISMQGYGGLPLLHSLQRDWH